MCIYMYKDVRVFQCFFTGKPLSLDLVDASELKSKCVSQSIGGLVHARHVGIVVFCAAIDNVCM